MRKIISLLSGVFVAIAMLVAVGSAQSAHAVASCVTLNELQNVNDAPYPNGQVRSSVTALFDGYDGGTVQHFTDAGWIYDIRQYNHCSSGDAYDAGVWFKRPAGTDIDTHPFRAYNKGWNAFFAKAKAKVASCIVRAEYDQLNAGMTRSHVEDDIFDGYDGSQIDFIHTASADYVWRQYAHCADGTVHAALRFRRLDGETLWKLWNSTYFGCWTNSIQFGCSGPKGKTPDGIEVNEHGVVVSSSLPHCTVENASSGPRPCTWNVGPMYDPSDGLSYWVGGQGAFAYVWNRSPLLNHPERMWSPSQQRCWLNRNTGVGKCPNGNTTVL